MAFYTGYQLIPINTYLAWKTAVAGNGYDADGYYGDQCWDLTAEFWYNVGFPQGYPLTGNGYAYGCWTLKRNDNISYNGTQYFDLITNLTDVKQGDVVVYNGTSGNPAGHIGFADEDYNPSKGGYLAILGQNQGSGGIPPAQTNPAGGTTANVKDLYTATDFLGAFRYRGWGGGPTPPTPSEEKRFAWAIFANKLRKRNNVI